MKATHVQPVSQVVPAEKPQDISPVPGEIYSPVGFYFVAAPHLFCCIADEAAATARLVSKAETYPGSVQSFFGRQGQVRPVSATRYMKTHVPISRLALSVGERLVSPRMDVAGEREASAGGRRKE